MEQFQLAGRQRNISAAGAFAGKVAVLSKGENDFIRLFCKFHRCVQCLLKIKFFFRGRFLEAENVCARGLR